MDDNVTKQLTYEDKYRIECLLREGKNYEEIARTVGISTYKVQSEVSKYSVAGVYDARVATALYYKQSREEFMESSCLDEWDFYIISGLYHSGLSTYAIVQRFSELKHSELTIRKVQTAIKRGLFCVEWAKI
ncbi:MULTISPECIES: hypothetical protein [unclassified Granulicatella]|uniref:hypothetical protein n=1 Tax=unclassified Granulicatella TaxID=2630493 RepID=UPI0010732D8D|nr:MULTISPECIES: hypothetical protein [unclassified Granulicatella]MBF0780665.1 hypothetical protein [Granulicatella sp. 19428wC4_WM01]TFU94242.1 hypothetical protein E4T68_06105 [Granulicatella sp. WM01]